MEIGCGSGDLLYEAKIRGFSISGIEISLSAAAQANEKLDGFYVRPTEDGNPTDVFDVMILADVIEHFRDPKKNLKHYASFIKTSGILFVTTPILDTMLAKVMGKHWVEYKPEHLFYFSKYSIQLILKDAGFTILAIEPNTKVLSLDYLTRHFIRFPVPVITPFMILLQKLLPERILKIPFKMRTSSMNIIAKKL